MSMKNSNDTSWDRGKFLEGPSVDLLSTRNEIYGNYKKRFLDTGSCESLPQVFTVSNSSQG